MDLQGTYQVNKAFASRNNPLLPQLLDLRTVENFTLVQGLQVKLLTQKRNPLSLEIQDSRNPCIASFLQT